MTEFWPWVPILSAAFAYLAWQRLLAYLRYFQQEGYAALRFLRWTNVRSLTDPAFWVAIASAFLYLLDPLLAVVLFAVGMVVLGLVQPEPRRSGKIPLRMTWRARRVLGVAMVLAVSAFVLLIRIFADAEVRAPLVAASVVIALLPLALLLADRALAPYERVTQRTFYEDAVATLARVHPFIVGITGSYGKSGGQHQHRDGRHTAHPRGPGARTPVYGRGDGRLRRRLDQAPVRAHTAGCGSYYGCGRHAPRALRLHRRDYAGEE